MKLIILTQYYPPEHGAPQNRWHDLVRRWRTKGVEVTVLTAMPNYPGGEVFPAYKGRWSLREEVDGVPVVRSWIWASKKKGIIPQLRAYFSFVFSSMMVGLTSLSKADFLMCESPPLFLGFTAVVLSLLKRAKLVMNISDLWPESAVQLGMLKPGPALSILEWFERFLYRSSVLVTCQTEGIVAGVKKSFPGARTFLFPNGVDPEMFQPAPRDPALRRELGMPEEGLVVGYGGNHGRSQGLSQVLEAASILKKEKVFFALFGDGPEKEELQVKAASLGLDNLRFYASRPRQEMCRVQALWDIALVPLKDLKIFEGARPSKMFELMAGGIPFVFCGKGEGAELAERSGCAVIVPPERPRELAEAILKLSNTPREELRQMGEAGHRFVLEHFDRSKLAGRFLEELESKITGRRP